MKVVFSCLVWFCRWDTRGAIFLHQKMGTFWESAHLYVPKNGTSGAATKSLRPFLEAQHPPKMTKLPFVWFFPKNLFYPLLYHQTTIYKTPGPQKVCLRGNFDDNDKYSGMGNPPPSRAMSEKTCIWKSYAPLCPKDQWKIAIPRVHQCGSHWCW